MISSSASASPTRMVRKNPNHMLDRTPVGRRADDHLDIDFERRHDHQDQKSSSSTSDECLTPSARAFTPLHPVMSQACPDRKGSASPTTITPQLKARLNFIDHQHRSEHSPAQSPRRRPCGAIGPSSSCHSPPCPSGALRRRAPRLWSCDRSSVLDRRLHARGQRSELAPARTRPPRVRQRRWLPRGLRARGWA